MRFQIQLLTSGQQNVEIEHTLVKEEGTPRFDCVSIKPTLHTPHCMGVTFFVPLGKGEVFAAALREVLQ
jgi:hypothetical protein